MIDPRNVLCEPLTISALAGWFRLGRRAMRSALDEIPGVARVGSLWRVPLAQMPPGYLVDAGLLVPTPIDAPTWAMLREEAEPMWPNPYVRPATTEPTPGLNRCPTRPRN